MLVLTRRPGQEIKIGDDVVIRVLSVKGDQVRIGIEAPRERPVYRAELLAAVSTANQDAVLTELPTRLPRPATATEGVPA